MAGEQPPCAHTRTRTHLHTFKLIFKALWLSASLLALAKLSVKIRDLAASGLLNF